MSKRVTRGFDPAALRSARENHVDERLRRREEVAQRAGIGVATLQHWESSRRSPQVDMLATVAAVLGVDLGQLVHVPVNERLLGDWRTLKGWTQPELARRAGLGAKTVARIENGEVPLRDGVARCLAVTLAIPVDEVYRAWERARTRPPESMA